MEVPIKLNITPYDYQKEGIEKGLEWKRLFLGDEPGLGKSQPLDSVIMTPNGKKKMGDIAMNDEIFGSDGEVYHVIGIFPQGNLPVYKVTFSDGSSCECSIDHLWNVRDENRRRKNKGFTTKTLKEILQSGIYLKSSIKREMSGRKPVPKWEIPVCSPLQYKQRGFIIPPYSMGVIIGDGCVCNCSNISFSLPDEKLFIMKSFSEELNESMMISLRRIGNINRYTLSKNESYPNRNHEANSYMKEIRDMELDVKSELKFIPEKYLYSSERSRIGLLRGLMDTDGSCSKNRTTYHTISKRLAYDVKELVESLGGIAIVRYYDRRSEGKKMEYQVNIRTNFCPFSFSEKASSWKKNKRFLVTRYISSIEYIGVKLCQCIKTSAPDELYITNEHIVTHNTCQSIGIVNTAKAYPALVICPSSLKINWKREFEKFAGAEAIVLNDNIKATWGYMLQMHNMDVCICNYESLRKYFVWEYKKGYRLKDIVFSPFISLFKSVIIDESHRCKDPGAQQSKFVAGLAAGKEYVMLLTGTPVVNRPRDLIAQLAIMDRLKEFGGTSYFTARYGDGENLTELSEKLYETCLVRREKKDVLTQLPDKTRMDIYIDIEKEAPQEYYEAYKMAEENLKEYLLTYKSCTEWQARAKMRNKALVQFMELRSLVGICKVKPVIDFIKDFVATGKKIVVFCSSHSIVDSIKKAFPKAVMVTGRENYVQKQAAVDVFQNRPEIQVIICSIKAAGVGITLTASSTVLFIEQPWTYADLVQCEDRCHRIGQKDNVTVYNALGNNSIDHRIYNLIQNKRSISNQIMASSDDIPKDECYFDELVNLVLNDTKKQNSNT